MSDKASKGQWIASGRGSEALIDDGADNSEMRAHLKRGAENEYACDGSGKPSN